MIPIDFALAVAFISAVFGAFFGSGVTALVIAHRDRAR